MNEPLRIQINSSEDNKPSAKQLFEDLSVNIEWTLKTCILIAKIKRTQYDAFIEEGFSIDQSLFLIK